MVIKLGRWRRFVVAQIGTIVLLTILCLSLSVNVVLGRRIYGTAKPVSALGGIKLETLVEDIPVIGIDGKSAVLSLVGDRPTLVYVFSPTCGWCKANYENILALADRARSHYRIVGLSSNGSIEDLRKHISKAPLPFEVFLVDSAKVGNRPFLVATPTTLLVATNSKISRAWIGAYNDDRGDEIEKVFSVRLPGLVTGATPGGL